MTFALIRAHLKAHPTVNANVAARLLNRSPVLASNELCRWCKRGYLERVKRGVWRDTGKYMRGLVSRERHRTIESRVLEVLREHGMMRATRVQVFAGLENRNQAHRALWKLTSVGKVRRVKYGMYAAEKENP